MMKIRMSLIIIGSLILSSNLMGQVFRGLVIDSESERPLEYVNIGVVDISYGTVTNESGEYIVDCGKLSKDCKVQVSMIGYESQTFNIEDLKVETKTIRLIKKTYELDEVIIKWEEIIKKVGTTKTSKIAGVCGWGGTDFGKGHELGLLVETGEKSAKIENINLKIRKQSFDTIVFRLHIRSILNGLPSDEQLTENIYLSVTNTSGWQQIDLSDHNILISGDIALSIEWIKISNVIEKNMLKMNGAKEATPIVLFDMNNKKGTLFIRRGSAAKWRMQENSAPGFYITIKE